MPIERRGNPGDKMADVLLISRCPGCSHRGTVEMDKAEFFVSTPEPDDGRRYLTFGRKCAVCQYAGFVVLGEIQDPAAIRPTTEPTP
jgi:hypothetical protein